MDWATQRERMIEEQIVRRGIRNPRVLEALRGVPRERFFPPSLQQHAYDDKAFPIGLDQTISQPFMVAWMLHELALEGSERVLEIGTGSGYNAALLSHLAKHVDSIERLPELSKSAQTVLTSLGITNVTLHVRDGSGGLPKAAPFDAIIVTASAPALPSPLSGQLSDGGKLLVPLRSPERYDVLTLFRRRGDALEKKPLGNCAFVPLFGEFGNRP